MIDFEFKISEKFKKLINLQITQTVGDDYSYYEQLSQIQFDAIKKHIDNPKKILDLGCGLGRMSIYLNYMLKNPDIEYILADGSCGDIPVKQKYGWNPAGGFYNDLQLTEEFVKANGVYNYSILDLSKETICSLKDVDMVMSFLSVGFHYPIEPYLKDLIKIANNDAIFVFGVRSGKYSIEFFKQYFSNVFLGEGTEDRRENIFIMNDILR